MAALVRLIVLVVSVCACAQAQYAEERAPRYIASEPKAPVTPPVAILKQINRHNEDGSYTYGYEAGDGSFKIETKSPTGEVKGKYGYKDDSGKLRVIEYGADKYGFQPAGEGITVAPPTLVDETKQEQQRPSKGGKSQYRAPPPQQSIDYDYEDPAPAPPPRPRPQPQQQYRPAPQPEPQYRPAPQPTAQYRSQPQPEYRQAPQQPQFRPAPQHQSAPTPPRPSFFPGASPSQSEDTFFSPAPQPKPQRPKQDFRPSPQPQQFPQKTEVQYSQNFNQPQYQEPRYTPSQNQFAPQPQRNQPFSMLDQLLKEYSLPQGGAAPLHDITFGSY